MGFTPDASVMSAMFITFGIATILLIFRLVSRKITNVALWLDDLFAIISWVSSLVRRFDDSNSYRIINKVAAALYFGFTIYCKFTSTSEPRNLSSSSKALTY
jgi:xanthine/uracil permease